ncbi:uncharacterized protein LOC124915797 [Impatiens glandulifera]|uniref:uncharacterized protein LOC124915797 n=1 Tax=Impatiens glandulifera TaxID=253017 RepID=UPI001FB10F7A|nr:uncharacterized protein LOC124915797 [Impatiens glandulifera]
MLHHNINTGPGVLLPSSKIIRSKQFREKKQPTPGSTGGRKKKSTAKTPSPVKDKSGGTDKQPRESAKPQFETRDEEESASTSDRTGSQKTDENPSDREGPFEEDQSATSLDNAERHVAGTPKAKLQLLVLDKLEIKKGEFTEEIDRLDAVHRQRETAHSPRLETNDGQNRGETPPLADPVINETDERTKTPFTGPFETDRPGDTEPVVTEEKVKTLIQEFANSKVRPWKRKIKKVARQTILLAEKTRDDLVKAEVRITDIEDDYRNDTVLHNDHLQQTEDLEDKTSRMVDDMGRFERETEQQLTKVDEDLGRSCNEAASTLNKVISLEEKNASLEDRNTQLEANLKALTEQKTKAASSSPVPAKRKRKTPSRKVQIAGMLERITETIIETQPNPSMHTEDELEENLEPCSTGQRVSNAVPISTGGQPQAEGSSSRPDQPDEEEPTDAMMKDFIFSESE